MTSSTRETSSNVIASFQASIDKMFMQNKRLLTARNSYCTKSEEEPPSPVLCTWQELQFDTKNEVVRLDVDEEKLENSPGFDKDDWPTQPQRDFVDEVYAYYGYESYYNTRSTV